MANQNPNKNVSVAAEQTPMLDTVRGLARPVLTTAVIVAGLVVWSANAETIGDAPLVKTFDVKPPVAEQLDWRQPDFAFEGVFRDRR